MDLDFKKIHFPFGLLENLRAQYLIRMYVEFHVYLHHHKNDFAVYNYFTKKFAYFLTY